MIKKTNTCSSHLSWNDESFLSFSWGTQNTNIVIVLPFWPKSNKAAAYFSSNLSKCVMCNLAQEKSSLKNVFPVNPSKLHHMALNLCSYKHLYALERSAERFALSDLLGSRSRGTFHHPAQFWPVNSNWSTEQFHTLFCKKPNVWIISLSGENCIKKIANSLFCAAPSSWTFLCLRNWLVPGDEKGSCRRYFKRTE